MKYLIVFLAVLATTTAFSKPSGSLNCFYELYAKSHFEKPVITKAFELDLNETKYVDTSHEYLKNIIRLRYSPATVDGKKIEHLSFSLTYQGTHAGAAVPMSNGRHIIQIAGDNTDLAGAFLNCDVQIN